MSHHRASSGPSLDTSHDNPFIDEVSPFVAGPSTMGGSSSPLPPLFASMSTVRSAPHLTSNAATSISVKATISSSTNSTRPTDIPSIAPLNTAPSDPLPKGPQRARQSASVVATTRSPRPVRSARISAAAAIRSAASTKSGNVKTQGDVDRPSNTSRGDTGGGGKRKRVVADTKAEMEVKVKVEDRDIVGIGDSSIGPTINSGIGKGVKEEVNVKREVEDRGEGSSHSHCPHESSSAQTDIPPQVQPKKRKYTSKKPSKKALQVASGAQAQAGDGGESSTLQDDGGVQNGEGSKAKGKGKAKAKDTKKVAAPKTPKKGEGVEDKRNARVRVQAPQSVKSRLQRVMTQRMYLVDRAKVPGNDTSEQFKVLGSTGNVYTINIDSSPRCDCPDCKKGNVPCKHIIFVFLKVLKVETHSTLWYQKSLLKTELESIFESSPPIPSGSLMVTSQVRNAFLKATGAGGDEEKVAEAVAAEVEEMNDEGRKWSDGDDCPVCYESMTKEEEKKGMLVFDEAMAGCGKPLHSECFKMWAMTATSKRDQVTCVWCRTPWPNPSTAGKGKGKAPGGAEYTSTGYLNMADIAGMSRQRDTSTYYQGPMRGVPRWDPRFVNRYADD